MTVFDKVKLLETIKRLQKKHGKNAIYILGKEKKDLSIQKLKTGFNDFDEMLEGGLPKSRVIEIFGAEGAGKTSICLAISANVGLTAYIDAEGTLDEKRAIELGISDKRMMIVRPESGEEICDVVVEFVKANVPLIIIDSVPSIIPYSFLEKIYKTAFEADNIAGTARLLSQKLFPTLIPALKRSSSIVIFVNQIRDRIGFIFGSPVITPGGHALKHYTALRIQIRRKSWFGKIDNRIGQLCSFRVIKSKVSHPYRECELCLHFEKGFITHKEMKKLLKKRKKNVNR